MTQHSKRSIRAERMSSDEQIHATLAQHKEQMAAITTEVAVIKERTNALEVRTDRMMSDSAENRAEMRGAVSEILKEIRHLRDYQKTMEGSKSLSRWATPVIASVGLGIFGLCLTVAALLWKVFGA